MGDFDPAISRIETIRRDEVVENTSTYINNPLPSFLPSLFLKASITLFLILRTLNTNQTLLERLITVGLFSWVIPIPLPAIHL